MRPGFHSASCVFVLFVLFLAPSLAAAVTTWHVDPDGTGDVATIQDALDAAADGDEIVLENGVYVGSDNRHLDFLGKAVTLRSAGGDPEQCVLDCDGGWDGFGEPRGLIFVSGEGPSTVVDGITVTRATDGAADIGSTYYGGVGIYAVNASPTFRNVVITQVDSKEGFGSAVYVYGGSPTFENCTISGVSGQGVEIHSASAVLTGCTITASYSQVSTGGGLVVSGSSVEVTSSRITRCGLSSLFFGPFAGGGVAVSGGSLSLTDCLIAENMCTGGDGGGLYVAGSADVTLDRVTIAGNRAQSGGGIVMAGGTASLLRTIVFGNCADADGPAAHLSGSSSLTADCSVIDPAHVTGPGGFVNGAGNLAVDPSFCDPLLCTDSFPATTSYALQFGSPALTASCGPIGVELVPCAVAVAPATWGRIKDMYR